MERPDQCPFIDRVDHRCSSYFSLERLGHTFAYCFDRFKACPLYREMMAERRAKRTLDDEAGRVVSADDVPTLWVAAANHSGAAHAASRFVQVRVRRSTRLDAIADAYAQHAAPGSRVPVAFGV